MFENPETFQVINYTSAKVIDYFLINYEMISMLYVSDTQFLISTNTFVELYDIKNLSNAKRFENVSLVR